MNVFSVEGNILGEGALWHTRRNTLFWLDILERKLFEKAFDSNGASADRCWTLPEHASALAEDGSDGSVLWMVTDRGFGRFDLQDGQYRQFLDLGLGDRLRANDGGASPDGSFWFGTMQWSPSGRAGRVYSIHADGTLIDQGLEIGIPNTFCWNAGGETLYLSDSYRQLLLSYRVEDGRIHRGTGRILADLSGGKAAPDGGAVDAEGFLWCANWDGHKVVKYAPDGETLDAIHMPVPRPTCCCFGGPEFRHLFITSARDGLDAQELARHPDSGHVFVLEMPVPGLPCPKFRWVSEC